MRRPSGQRLMQGLVVAVFVVAAVMAVRLIVRIADSDDSEFDTQGFNMAESTDDAYSVIEAIAVTGGEPVAVRGWVFDGPFEEFGLRLCVGRDDDGEAPRCVGPFLSIKGQVGRGSFTLEEEASPDGVVAYSTRPAVVQGLVVGTELIAEMVLEQ